MQQLFPSHARGQSSRQIIEGSHPPVPGYAHATTETTSFGPMTGLKITDKLCVGTRGVHPALHPVTPLSHEIGIFHTCVTASHTWVEE
jgi:hypothetical protein